MRKVLLYLAVSILMAARFPIQAQNTGISKNTMTEHSMKIDLYDERGFAKNGNAIVDGNTVVSEANGNVTYVYPLSQSSIDNYPLNVSLTYNGAVATSSFALYNAWSGLSVDQYQWERFSQNRPAWIIGVNGFAVQTLSTTTFFQCDPKHRVTDPVPNKAYDDSHCLWAIDGYDYCNRMNRLDYSNSSDCGNSDQIRLLRADGSLLDLRNTMTIRDITGESGTTCSPLTMDIQDARLYTGYYIPSENNTSAYGVVSYDDKYWTDILKDHLVTMNSGTLQACSRPRVLRYYPGDGLEYVFREVVAPYGLMPYLRAKYERGDGSYDDLAFPYGYVDKGPTIFYLEEINSGTRNLTTFTRSRHLPDQEGDDYSVGRALMTGFHGHTFSYGDNFVVMEAYGKTTKIKFRAIRSGERRPEEPVSAEQTRMPLATHGYHTNEQAIDTKFSRLASSIEFDYPSEDKAQNITYYQSHLGLVTEILDPENRSRTFEYEKYTRKYRNYDFPNSDYHFNGASTLTLSNWRLNKVIEPTTQYEISYYDTANNYQEITKSVSGYWSAYSGTNNVASSLVKKDRQGVTLNTMQFGYTLLDGGPYGTFNYPGGYTQYNSLNPVDKDLSDLALAGTPVKHTQDIAWRSNIIQTDNIENKTVRKEIIFHRYMIKMLRSNSEDCDFSHLFFCPSNGGNAPMLSISIPRKTTVTTGSITTTTIENYKYVAQNLYLPGYSKTMVRESSDPDDDIVTSLKTIDYTLTPELRFIGQSDVADRFGRDIATQTTTIYRPDNLDIYLKEVTEYRHLPLVEESKGSGVAKGTDTTLLRVSTQQLTESERRAGTETTHNVYEIKTPPLNQSIVYRWPPLFRLTAKSYITDENDLVQQGKAYTHDQSTDVYSSGSHRRGAVLEEKILGTQTTGTPVPELTVANYGYTAGTYPTFTNKLRTSLNIFGARQEYFYDYNLPELSGNYPTGKLLKNDGTIVNKKLYDDFRLFDEPLAKKMYVRKWNSLGALVQVPLTEYFERSYYNMPHSLIKGTVDANGWYSHFEYDWLGRIKQAWLPMDFPASNSGAGITSRSLRLYGNSQKTVYIQPITNCGTPTLTYDPTNPAQILVGKSVQDWLKEMIGCPIFIGRYEANSHGEITYKAYSNDVVHQVGGSKRAFLRLFLSSAAGKDLVVKISTASPEFTKWLHFENKVEPYSPSQMGNTTTKRQQRDLPNDADMPYASCKGNYYIYIPLSDDLLTHMQTMSNGQELTFRIEMASGDGLVQFANDADDVRPAIVVDGTFASGPEFAADDFTLAYRYDDCTMSTTVYGKIDDVLHTVNPAGSFPVMNPMTGAGSNSRYAQIQYSLGADYQVKSATKQGVTTLISYTGLGKIKTTTEAATGFNIQTTYDEMNRPLTTTHPDNTSATTAYLTGLPTDIMPVGLGVSDSDYFGFCSRITTTDEMGVQAVQYYDAFGRLRCEVADPSGINTVVQYEYDKLGRVTQVTNPKSQQTSYSYDTFGRVKTKSQPDLGAMSYAYDRAGNVRFSQTQQQHEENKLSFYQYDDLNRPTVIGEATLKNGDGNPLVPTIRLTDWLEPNILHNGGVSSTMLTANATMFRTMSGGGNAAAVLSPLEIVECHPADASYIPKTQDMLGEILPAGMSFLRHPASAFPTVNNDYNLDTTNFESISANAQFVQTGMWYDEFPTSAGGIWLHFPSATQWNDLAPTGTVRNLKGRLAAVAYRGHGNEPYHFTVYSYDERGRVEALLRYTENLGYDAVYYTYNSMDVVTSITVADPMRQHTTWYATDDFGRTSTVNISLSSFNQGLGIPSVYPTVGLTQPALPDITYKYNNRGLLESMEYAMQVSGGGAVTTRKLDYQYNTRKWPVQMQLRDDGSTVMFAQTLSYNDGVNYDGRGQVWSQWWQYNGGTAQTQYYDYDNLRRLTSWSQGLQGEDYDYDKVGNREMWTPTGGTPFVATYAPGQNRLTKVGNVSLPTTSELSYDANGAVVERLERDNSTNVITDQEKLWYTSGGLLRLYHHVIDNGNSTDTRQWYYRYSAAGEREQKRMSDYGYIGDNRQPSPAVEAAWVYYALGADQRQHAVYHATKTQYSAPVSSPCGYAVSPYVYFYPTEYLSYGVSGVANIVMKRDAGSDNVWHKEYKVQDHLGSTRIVLDESGSIIGQYDYEPFGKVMPGVGSAQRLSYIDKEKDEESGLGDFGVRKYEDGYGRFMSVDPLWESYRGMTPYHYSRNNPLVLSDPSGMADYLDPNGKKLGSDGEDNNDIYYTTGDIYKKHTTDKGTDWSAIRAAEGTELRPPQEAVQGVYDNVYKKINSTQDDNNMKEHGGAIGEDGKFYPGPSGPRADITSGSAEFNSNPAILGMVKDFGVYPAWTVHSHLQSTSAYTASGRPSENDYKVQAGWQAQIPKLHNAILINPNNGGWVTFHNTTKVTISVRADVFFQGVNKSGNK